MTPPLACLDVRTAPVVVERERVNALKVRVSELIGKRTSWYHTHGGVVAGEEPTELVVLGEVWEMLNKLVNS